MSKIGNLIQQLRIKNGLTQAQLAEKLGITDKAVGKWEQGQGDPDLSLIKPISKFFGISTDELLNGTIDEFTNDVNKSIYEKIVLSGLDKLPRFLEQGIDLFGTDEYNKSLIDYVYEHRNIYFLEYAIKNGWFENLEVQFIVTTKRNSYYGNLIENKSIVFYFQKRLMNKVKQTLIGMNNNQGKLVYRLQNSVEYTHSNTIKTSTILDYDTISILSIIIENEIHELFDLYANYVFFKKNDSDYSILEFYSKRSTFDKVFLNKVLKFFRFDVLLHLAIQSNNKALIDLLAKLSNPNIHSVSKEYFEELIKLNHFDINNNILLHENYVNQIDIALVYQFNKFVYDRLPTNIKQKNAHNLTEFVSDKSEEEVVLHLNAKELISDNKVQLLEKHLELVDKAVKHVDQFIENITTLKSNTSEYIFDKVIVNEFNNTFGKYFIYDTFNRDSYFNNYGILKDEQKEELIKINEARINHVWLQEKLNNASGKGKKYIYKYIKYTFDNSFEFQLSKMSDESISALIPFLNEDTKHKVLNSYNRDNPAVIKKLLEYGGKFYKDYNSNSSEVINFNYSTIEFRTNREVESDNMREINKFDLIKTLQFKLLLNVK
ncbi:MAG: helix-turn-helix domain-containing protein [Acholeplasmataceae bacterium]|nr:helix-turn-helix domain-containing protein [Acholeplasmataceae bacterium]